MIDKPEAAAAACIAAAVAAADSADWDWAITPCKRKLKCLEK
jgi:hypothetical protein